MPSSLFLSEIDPINLDGSIDVAGELQLAYTTSSLADHAQTLHAEHVDLQSPGGVVRIKLVDFSVGSVNWQLDAVHVASGTTITWSSGSGHAYYDFGPMTSEQAVDVTATSDESPAQTKTRQIRVKVSPTDAQPDRPR